MDKLYKYDNYKEFSWHIEDCINACQELQNNLFKLEFNLRKVDENNAKNVESMLKIIKYMLSGLQDMSK